MIRTTPIDLVPSGTDQLEVARPAYASGSDGSVLVDFINQFENVRSDLLEITTCLGVEPEYIPNGSRSTHEHYSSIHMRPKAR
jgi:hypothetical protein